MTLNSVRALSSILISVLALMLPVTPAIACKAVPADQGFMAAFNAYAGTISQLPIIIPRLILVSVTETEKASGSQSCVPGLRSVECIAAGGISSCSVGKGYNQAGCQTVNICGTQTGHAKKGCSAGTCTAVSDKKTCCTATASCNVSAQALTYSVATGNCSTDFVDTGYIETTTASTLIAGTQSCSMNADGGDDRKKHAKMDCAHVTAQNNENGMLSFSTVFSSDLHITYLQYHV